MNFSLLYNQRSHFIWLMAILLIPLFFINVRDSHSWEGDFAMYILQAKNIIEGVPLSDVPYIQNPESAIYTNPGYPVGFPLLLSPVYAIAGNSIMAFQLWVTVFLYGTGILMALYMRRYFSDLLAFFMVLIFIYNPWTLFLKAQVLPEFPFLFILLLCLILFEKYSRGPFWVGILIAVLGGLLISVKIIGFVFPIAVLIYAIRKRFIEKDKSPLTKCVCGFLVGFGSILFYLLINRLLFVFPQTEGGLYAGIWGGQSLYDTILANLAHYVEQFRYFFTPWGGSWNFLPLVLGSVALTFALIGMLRSFFRRLDLIDMIAILYIGVLIIYPFRQEGMLNLIPVMPFLILYIVKGLESINIFPKINKLPKTIFIGSLVLVSYFGMIGYIIDTQDQVQEGPQEKSSVEAFNFIIKNTADDDLILFVKPRVLALYTGRKSIANRPGQDSREIADLIFQYNIGWVLTHTGISDDAILNFIREQDYICEYFWNNDKFVLYKVSP